MTVMNDELSGTEWFVKARYGLFIHYGLYSQLGRGEWVMNRERIPVAVIRDLAKSFTPHRFNAEELCDLALDAGMRYVNLTTMHQEGFRLYDTELSDFNAMHYCGRDLVAEFVQAARERGLRVSLYHSLNNWFDQPDSAAALESQVAYDEFSGNTFARIRELLTRFKPIDIMWYDGWWPFHAAGWKAEAMNRMVRDMQPHILVNGRNALAGDFGTPEQHMAAPQPWRPWEACITLNDHWGYHRGDHNWKHPSEVVDLLATAAAGQGNLLLNIGPRGDGSVPETSARILQDVGQWLRRCGSEAIYDGDTFTFGLTERAGHNGEWSSNGKFTLKGRSLYHLVRYWPGSEVVIAGLDTVVNSVCLLTAHGDQSCVFQQFDGKVVVQGLPDEAPDPICTVLRYDCTDVPSLCLGAGMRIPNAPHPPYDPSPADMTEQTACHDVGLGGNGCRTPGG